jgi:hypothetical protein
MSRFTDLNADMIFALAGWNKDSRLRVYEEFIERYNLIAEFTEFCRTKAEGGRSDDEVDEDETNLWHDAGAPLCPHCRVPYNGDLRQSHKMGCCIGHVGPQAYLDHVCPEMGAYYRNVVRYVKEVCNGEEEAQ